ncbi:MAG: DUF3293 domain-containing protein [Bacteroidota bacterium]
MPKKEFESVYLSAIYELNSPRCIIQIGAPSPSILLKVSLQISNWAFITAHNPGSQIQTLQQNEQANARLLEKIRELDLQHLDGVAKSQDGHWPEEISYLVYNLSKEKALQLARSFGQNAILFCSLPGNVELIWV